MPPSEIHFQIILKIRCALKKKRKWNCGPMQDGRNFVRRTPVVHRGIPSRRRPQARTSRKHLRKKKEKPKIQIQILKLDKISGVLWEISFFSIMLLPGRNCVLRDDFPIPLNRRPSMMTGKLEGDKSKSEPWIGETRLAVLNNNPPADICGFKAD